MSAPGNFDGNHGWQQGEDFPPYRTRLYRNEYKGVHDQPQNIGPGGQFIGYKKEHFKYLESKALSGSMTREQGERLIQILSESLQESDSTIGYTANGISSYPSMGTRGPGGSQISPPRAGEPPQYFNPTAASGGNFTQTNSTAGQTEGIQPPSTQNKTPKRKTKSEKRWFGKPEHE
ncbi:hypothetical protein H1R20_g10619, partial [Candolleomyces eurysporus]